jgi:uncharacterized lipoprotein YajG
MTINHMKKIISLLAVTLLAGCGHNSTENQSGPVNPPAGEPASNSTETSSAGVSVASNSSPIIETVTNNPATNFKVLDTNSPAVTNQSSGN